MSQPTIFLTPIRRLVALTVGIAIAFGAVSVASGQTPPSPLVAPVTTLSADGRSATDGSHKLTVSKAKDIEPAGEVVTIEGAGYNTEKGIYVAFCQIPAKDQTPTPCGGGMDMSGTSSSAAWISSNVPSYGEGLAKGYGAGGTFSLSLAVAPKINDTVDCMKVRCAIVSRNDHTRTTDRSQDIFVPVTFKGSTLAAASAPASTAGGTTASTKATEAKANNSKGGGSSTMLIAGVAVVVGLVGVGGLYQFKLKGARQ